MHPNSLRNLKRPLPGEVRNPTGRNQYTKDRERRQAFRGLCKAMDEGSEDVTEEMRLKLAELFVQGAIDGDARLIAAIVDSEWPVLPRRQRRWPSGQ